MISINHNDVDGSNKNDNYENINNNMMFIIMIGNAYHYYHYVVSAVIPIHRHYPCSYYPVGASTTTDTGIATPKGNQLTKIKIKQQATICSGQPQTNTTTAANKNNSKQQQ